MYKSRLACKVRCGELAAFVTLWGGALKTIEGKYMPSQMGSWPLIVVDFQS